MWEVDLGGQDFGEWELVRWKHAMQQQEGGAPLSFYDFSGPGWEGQFAGVQPDRSLGDMQEFRSSQVSS